MRRIVSSCASRSFLPSSFWLACGIDIPLSDGSARNDAMRAKSLVLEAALANQPVFISSLMRSHGGGVVQSLVDLRLPSFEHP